MEGKSPQNACKNSQEKEQRGQRRHLPGDRKLHSPAQPWIPASNSARVYPHRWLLTLYPETGTTQHTPLEILKIATTEQTHALIHSWRYISGDACPYVNNNTIDLTNRNTNYILCAALTRERENKLTHTWKGRRGEAKHVCCGWGGKYHDVRPCPFSV